MRSFWESRSGNFAVIFAAGMVPVLGTVGIAVDYARAVNVRSFIQGEADGAALSAAQLGPQGQPRRYLQHLKEITTAQYGQGDWIDKLKTKGDWISATDYRVEVEGDVPLTILTALPGYPKSVPVRVTATARLGEPRYIYKPPRMTQLDPEAADYNRMSVYCFDPNKGGNGGGNGHDDDDDGEKSSVKGKRSKEIVIADNAGSSFEYEMPVCEGDERMSYKLVNIRNARTSPERWESKTNRHEYFTDTRLMNGVETYDLDGWQILETVLCNSLQECRPVTEGGIIPVGRGRVPQRATGVCTPGKFMYYGWEDRPPGAGWTDQDYDDIRIIIECPAIEALANRKVLLID